MAVVMKTERQIMKEFLELYRDSPCLWYQQHSLYLNREAREQAYVVLLEKYRTIQEDATLDTVKKKIDNLRCAYKRERRKVEMSIADGTVPRYKPSLWYFKLLRFIDGASGGDLDDSTSSIHYEDVDSVYEELVCEPPPPKKEKKIKKEVSSIFIPELQVDDLTVTQSQRDNLHNHYESEIDSEAESFGRTVGLQLKEIEPMQRFIAEKLISEIIFYGRLDKLNTQSNISLN